MKTIELTKAEARALLITLLQYANTYELDKAQERIKAKVLQQYQELKRMMV